jgi:hypothetical protein
MIYELYFQNGYSRRPNCLGMNPFELSSNIGHSSTLSVGIGIPQFPQAAAHSSPSRMTVMLQVACIERTSPSVSTLPIPAE